MTSPRYQPASYLIDPAQFGRVERPQWRAEHTLGAWELDQLGAARLQHQLAWRMRAAIKQQHETEAAYAATGVIAVTRLRRLLRGQIVARLEDIALARRTLGV